HHLQVAAPHPYPGVEQGRNAALHQSLFADSDNGSNWSDSEAETSNCQDDKASTRVVIRRQRAPPRRNLVVNEPNADQGDWDNSRYPRRPGGQVLHTAYRSPTKPYPAAGDPYFQSQPPLGHDPQVHHRPAYSGPLPPVHKDMAYKYPFTPGSMPQHGHQTGPYSSYPPGPVYEPQQAWHPAAEYGHVPPSPEYLSADAPGAYPYPDPTVPYCRGHVPFDNSPNPPTKSEPTAPPRIRQRRPPADETHPQEHDLDNIQRRLRAVEIEGQHAKVLRQTGKERAQAEQQRREIDLLRQDIERSHAGILDAFDDIRREIQMSQSESHSEPSRLPLRMDMGDSGGGEKDVLMREIAQFIEGKRRLQPQEHAAGAAFRQGSQGGLRSTRGSRLDPELRSEVETIVYDILGGSDVGPRGHWRASLRSHGGAASDSFRPRTARQVDPRNWAQETLDGGGRVKPSTAANRPADEKDWVGSVPRKSGRPRSRREDGGGKDAIQTHGARFHHQQPLPPHGSISRQQAGAKAPDSRGWGVEGGGGKEAVFSDKAMAYQDSIANGAYGATAAHDDQDPAGSFTDDESDEAEVLPKREARYPEFPAGHPDLRYRAQLPPPPAPKPPNLRQTGM
ncbi:hypothetical protein LX36DRAFT_582019, partial [Colletotrichum falcatum]